MMLSIITINYNNKEGLRCTIESVVNQTCTDYEFIIIDGGSTDGSVDIIKQYENKITYWVSEKDRGIYNAMNKGIAVSKGDYCNFLNSGDTLANNNVLSIVMPQINGKDIYIGNACCMSFSNGQEVFKCIWKSPSEISMKNLFIATPNHQATIIKTKLMKDIGYNESYKILSDFEFFMEALIRRNCKYEKLDITIVKYLLGGTSTQDRKHFNYERNEILHRYLSPRVINDYDSIYTHPSKMIKLTRYNMQFPIACTLCKIALAVISIPFRCIRYTQSMINKLKK